MSATNGASPGRPLTAEEFDRRADLAPDDPAGDLEPYIDWSKARRPGRDEGAPGVILRLWLAVVRWTLRRTDWCLITDADIDGIAQTAFTSGCELGRRQQAHGLGSRTPRYLEHERHRW